MWQALWRFKYDLSLLFGGCPRLLKPPLKGCFWKKADLFFSLERLVSFWRCPRQSSFWSDVLTYLRTYLLQHGSDWVRATGGGRCPTQFKLLLQPTLHRHSVAAQWAYYSCVQKSSGLPKAEVFGRSQRFSLFGLRLRPPKFLAKYSACIFVKKIS